MACNVVLPSGLTRFCRGNHILASYPAVRTMDDGGNHKSKHMHTRTTTTEERKVLGKSKSFDKCSTQQTQRLNPHLKPFFHVQPRSDPHTSMNYTAVVVRSPSVYATSDTRAHALPTIPINPQPNALPRSGATAAVHMQQNCNSKLLNALQTKGNVDAYGRRSRLHAPML